MPVVVLLLLPLPAASSITVLLLHRVDSYSTAVGEAGGRTGCLTIACLPAYTSPVSASLQRGAETH